MEITYACCAHCILDDSGECIDASMDHAAPCNWGCNDSDDVMPCGCESGSCYCDDDGLTDVEADAMTLASAGWGTDEDYGFYGDDFEYDYGE